MQHRLDVYRRPDGKWSWQLHAANGRVVAVDGPDGHANRADAVNTARELLAGDIDVKVDEAALRPSAACRSGERSLAAPADVVGSPLRAHRRFRTHR